MGLTVLICDIAADLKPALCLHFQYLSFSSADFLYRLFIKKKKKKQVATELLALTNLSL